MEKNNPFFFEKNSVQKLKTLRLKRPKHFQKNQSPGEKNQKKWTPLKKN